MEESIITNKCNNFLKVIAKLNEDAKKIGKGSYLRNFQSYGVFFILLKSNGLN